jgi:hypothetical protein
MATTCRSVAGNECQFPFKKNGQTYDRCIQSMDGIFNCPTDHSNLEECGPDCPKETCMEESKWRCEDQCLPNNLPCGTQCKKGKSLKIIGVPRTGVPNLFVSASPQHQLRPLPIKVYPKYHWFETSQVHPGGPVPQVGNPWSRSFLFKNE